LSTTITCHVFDDHQLPRAISAATSVVLLNTAESVLFADGHTRQVDKDEATGEYVINGQKVWITGAGGYARCAAVCCCVLLCAAVPPNITCVSTTRTLFKDVF
jgi:hypothetical protein